MERMSQAAAKRRLQREMMYEQQSRVLAEMRRREQVRLG